jgi:hypothetical protein
VNAPWFDLRDDSSNARHLETALSREIPRGHMLEYLSPTAIAYRPDEHNVLFSLTDGRYAIVELRGRLDADPSWPRTRVYESWAAVASQLEDDAASFGS